MKNFKFRPIPSTVGFPTQNTIDDLNKLFWFNTETMKNPTSANQTSDAQGHIVETTLYHHYASNLFVEVDHVSLL